MSFFTILRILAASTAITFLCPTVSRAQEYKGELPARIVNDLNLTEGIYKISGEVTIERNARLKAAAGVQLIFDSSAVIRLYGGIELVGTPGKWVELKSINYARPGYGLEIAGLSPDKVTIRYARFFRLAEPLLFSTNWYRPEVSISESVFKYCGLHRSLIEFDRFDDLNASGISTVRITGNTIVNNNSGIFITDVSTDKSRFVISGNVITRNEFMGNVANGMFTAPLFFGYNIPPGKPLTEPEIDHNAMLDNFSYVMFHDSISSTNINLSVVGTSKRLPLPNNYWGRLSAAEVLNAIDTTSGQQYPVPRIQVTNSAIAPPADLHGFFYRVWLNDTLIKGTEFKLNRFFPFRSLRMKSNKKFHVGRDFAVRYFYSSNGALNSLEVPVRPVVDSVGASLAISFGDFFRTAPPNGYLIIDGLYDDEGFDLAAFSFGKKEFSIENNIDYNDILDLPGVQEFEKLKQEMEKMNNQLKKRDSIDQKRPEKPEKPEKIEKLKTSGLSIGAFIGACTYYGDVLNGTISFNPATYNLGGGVRLIDDLSDRLSIDVRAQYVPLKGADVGSGNRSTGYSRGLSFKDNLLELAAIVHYRLAHNDAGNFGIYVHGGVSIVHFNPKGEYKGKSYSLRDFGTAGQTAPGGTGKYSQISGGIPLGIDLRKWINPKISVGWEATVCRTFTDYIDDVRGGDIYPSAAELTAANPNNAAAAIALSNPSGTTGPRSYSSPNKTDWYMYTGFYLAFKLNTRSTHTKVDRER